MKVFYRLNLLSPLVAVLYNLLLVYAFYFIARLVYMLENWSYFSFRLITPYLLDILGGGLIFDTSAILVTNIPYIVLMLFPIHYKESAIYQKLCRAVFLVINGLALEMVMGRTAVAKPPRMPATTKGAKAAKERRVARS